MQRRQFLGWMAGGAAALTGAATLGLRQAAAQSSENGLALWNEEPATSATVTVADPARIRLLQVTDLHFFCKWENKKYDRQTVDDLQRLVDANRPDVLMVTGDLWHDNPNGKGEHFMRTAVGHLESLGVPWLYTWGNHDDLNDFALGHAFLTRAKNSLYRGGPNGGCYTVRLLDSAGAPVWDVVCLNTTDLGMQPRQQEWLRAEQARRASASDTPANAFAAFHIPLKQYDDLWQTQAACGVKFEAVCNEQEDGSSFAALRAIGGLRACFCGHDHVNDYSGTVDGVELVYGRATGTAGYGGDKVPKGAKLIVANAQAGQYEWQTVYPDGRSWTPAPGTHIDVWREGLWDTPAEASA